MKILICEDHEIYRKGLRLVLEHDFNAIEILEAEHGDWALDLMKNNKFDLVLMDIRLPGKNGLFLLYKITLLYPDTKVLMLSLYTELQFARQAFRLGAMGYLNKNEDSPKIIHAIKTVIRGEKHFSVEVMESMTARHRKDLKKTKHELLSDYEFMIMLEIAKGKSSAVIAKEMETPVNTLYVHKNHIMNKLEIKTVVDLHNYCVAQGFLINCNLREDTI